MMTEPMAFIDLAAQRRRLGKSIEEAMLRVVEHGRPHPRPRGKAVRERHGGVLRGKARHLLRQRHGRARPRPHGERHQGRRRSLLSELHFRGDRRGRGLDRRHGDLLRLLSPDSFTLDPASLEAGLKVAKEKGLRPAVVIPVDLFGQPADYEAIEPICAREGMFMLSDAAPELRRELSRPQSRDDRARDDHELLPGETARLLRGWRRHLHG